VGCSLPVNGIDPSDPGNRGEPGEDGKEEIEGGAEPEEDGKEEIGGGERDDISSGLLGSIAYMPIVELPDNTVNRSC
jgi:hypothetical protein